MKWPLIFASTILLVALDAASPAGAAPNRSSLELRFLGVAIDAQPGHIRVSEVAELHNATGRTVREDVAFPLPREARYVTFHEGLQRPRVEAMRIVDRLIVKPGTLRVAYAYSVAGSGEVVLEREWSMPIDRVEVFASAPALVRSPRLETAPPVEVDGRIYTRALARDVRPGTLVLTVIGVPSPRLWRAPAAAGILAGLLIIGLVCAVMQNRHAAGR